MANSDLALRPRATPGLTPRENSRKKLLSLRYEGGVANLQNISSENNDVRKGRRSEGRMLMLKDDRNGVDPQVQPFPFKAGQKKNKGSTAEYGVDNLYCPL